MNTTASQEKRWFKTSPQFFQPLINVDQENGIIKDVSVCTVGEAEGHDMFLDISFISDVVKLGNEFKQGVKSRFGHPSLSNEALGTYLGRFKNFRVSSSDKAVADLYLDDVAKKSPGGDLYSWVADMAAKNPDQFGASIVFEPGEMYQVINGKKIYGEAMQPDKPVYASIKALDGVDLVDEPAANAEGLFSSKKFNADKFAVRAADFFDANPDIWKFIDANPEKFKPFFQRYTNYKKASLKNKNMQPKTKKSFFKKLAEAFTNEESELFSQIDAVTDDGTNIRIDAAGDAPAVNDAVYIVDSSTDSTTVAPDADYTIAGGDFDGYVLTVVNGAITAVFNPNDPGVTITQSAVPTYKQLQQENSKIKNDLKQLSNQFQQLQKEFTKYKVTPLASHTNVVPDPETTNGNDDEDAQFYAKPWNKKAAKKQTTNA